MKYIYTTIVTVLLFVACNTEVAEPSHRALSEDPEQLKVLLANEPDALVKLDIYYALYKAYRQSSNLDQAFEYLNQQKQLAVELEDHLTAGRSCYNMGLIKKEQFDYIKAADLYLQAINYFERLGDTPRMAIVLDNIGAVFMETGNYEYAKKFYQKTKKFHNTEETKRALIRNLNLGICHFAALEPDYDTAWTCFQKALTLAEKLTEGKAYYLNRIYNQLGTMYYRSEKYQEAIENYQKSLKYTDVTQAEQEAIGFANIGEVYMEEGLYKEAELWLNKALTLSGQIDDRKTVGILNIFGRLYQRQDNHMMAVRYLENAIEAANKEVINEPLQESLRLIRDSYVALRKANKAVTVGRYENVLVVDGQQDLLEAELIEKTNFNALQSALGLSVELDHEKKAKKAEMQLNSLYVNLMIVLIILMVIIGAILFVAGRKIYQIRKVLKW